MKKQTSQKIVIIGCGNLAWHLAKHLISLKKFSLTIYNHRPNKELAAFKKLGCTVVESLTDITKDADFYFICVSDKFIPNVSDKIKIGSSSLVIHTSGSTNINQISHFDSCVFYPVQTFSVKDNINWTEAPILLEATTKSNYAKLKKLASLFSKQIIFANSEERLKIHLAAVLVNNFTNTLYTAADNLLSDKKDNKGLNFKILLPLIKQTTAKLDNLKPKEAQTGPAKRGDKKVMKEHLHLLKDKELKKVYKKLSKLIQQQHHSSHDKL